jgi:hypothetical protein
MMPLTTYRQHVALIILTASAIWLTAQLAGAQSTSTWQPPPTECTICEGEQGPPGPPGPPGPKGDPGFCEAGPRTVRPFDLFIRGINFNARAVVKDGAKLYVLVYAAQFPAAALVDVSTGLAQIAYPFDAEVGPDPAHPGELVKFDDVSVLAPRSFLWWHRGASWSHNWDESLPWQPMPGFSWRD